MAEETVIDVQDLQAGYGEEPILEGLNLRVRRHEIVALLGGSGSGKSTLLRVMVGLLPPIAGCVRLFGRDLYECSHAERTKLLRRIGKLFQSDALFGNMSVIENVKYPLRELTSLPEPVMTELARQRLGLMGLSGLEDRAPSDMSGGQRKRAALARATILDPEIVFCDEPTSGLDPVMAGALSRHLLQLRDALGITVVAVTHDIESVREMADRAVLLGHGSILADGSVPELAASDEPNVHAFFHRGVADDTDGDSQHATAR